MVSVVSESTVQETIIVPDTGTSSSLNLANTLSTVSSTSRISSGRPHKYQSVCKYAASNQICPFGAKCRFQHPKPTIPVCRHFIQGQCRYGDRCKFTHSVVKPITVTSSDEEGTTSSGSNAVLNVNDFPSIVQSTKKPKPDFRGNKPNPLPLNREEKKPSKDDPHQHRVLHHHDGSQSVPVELQLEAYFKRAAAITPKPAMSRPNKKPQQKKAGGDNKLEQVIQAEMRLLQEENMEDKDEPPREEDIVHILRFQPSDPEWIKQGNQPLQLIVTFTKDYPKQPFSVKVIDDVSITKSAVRAINVSLDQRVKLMHSEAVVPSGHVPMFRNLLSWFDQNVVDICDKGHIMPISADSDDDEEIWPSSEEGLGDEEDEGEEEEGLKEHLNSESLRPAKKGTEIRLMELTMNKNVATVQLTRLKITVQCTRCKNKEDVVCTPEKRFLESCEKCHVCHSLTVHSDILHPTNSSMCFMDIIGCKPVDVVMPYCEFTVVCLECQKECNFKGISYGEPLHVSCRGCHSRLQVAVEGSKFFVHHSGPQEIDDHIGAVVKKKKHPKEEFLIHDGQPLPEFGTCIHYKRSHRWLRFPCCGKPYPCDVCHDLAEDHPMERANRMICGYCSKEQVYSGIKPCVSCGSDMAQIRSSAHWEGGKGCRSKTKMKRNDPHKYKYENKIASKKEERVGLKGKINRENK